MQPEDQTAAEPQMPETAFRSPNEMQLWCNAATAILRQPAGFSDEAIADADKLVAAFRERDVLARAHAAAEARHDRRPQDNGPRRSAIMLPG